LSLTCDRRCVAGDEKESLWLGQAEILVSVVSLSGQEVDIMQAATEYGEGNGAGYHAVAVMIVWNL
jgi:hypothetical protein